MDASPRISPLRQRMIDDMRMRKLSEKTQSHYLRWVQRFTAFLGRAPDTATVEDLRRYQLHLVDHGTSPVSLNAAITGLKFFFEVTLDQGEPTEPSRSGVAFGRMPGHVDRRHRSLGAALDPARPPSARGGFRRTTLACTRSPNACAMRSAAAPGMGCCTLVAPRLGASCRLPGLGGAILPRAM